MRLPRPLPPATVLDPIDDEIARALREGDEYIASRYVRILKALSRKAEEGDKGAAEILLKCVVAPRREEIQSRSQAAPAPEPLNIRFTMFQVRAQVRGMDSPFVLTRREYEALRSPAITGGPDHKGEIDKLLTEGKAQIIDGELSCVPPQPQPTAGVTSSPGSPTPAQAAPQKPPNCVCAVCGSGFYNVQRTARYCKVCKRQRIMQRLQAYKVSKLQRARSNAESL